MSVTYLQEVTGCLWKFLCIDSGCVILSIVCRLPKIWFDLSFLHGCNIEARLRTGVVLHGQSQIRSIPKSPLSRDWMLSNLDNRIGSLQALRLWKPQRQALWLIIWLVVAMYCVIGDVLGDGILWYVYLYVNCWLNGMWTLSILNKYF